MHRKPRVSPRALVAALFCCVLPLRLSASTPQAIDDVIATNEDTPITYNVLTNDYDADGDTVQFIAVTQPPAHGAAISQGDGSVMYVPAPDFSGTDSFEYWISDGTHTHRDGATVYVYVLAANDAPTTTLDRFFPNHGTSVVCDVLANDSDVDGDELAVLTVTQPASGTARLNPDSTVTYTSPATHTGQTTFTYTVTDGKGGQATGTVYITATDLNEPVAQADAYATAEDTALSVPLVTGVLANDSDADGDALTAAVVANPSHGTLTLSADGSFVYTPAANYNGTDSFTYRASDGILTSNAATVTLTVTAVDDVPVALADAYSVLEGGVLTVAAPGVLANDSASDPDGDALTAVDFTNPSNGNLTPGAGGDGSFTYTPASGFSGTDSFTYRADDGRRTQSAPATVTITVTAVDDPPVVNNAPAGADKTVTTLEDTAYTFTAVDFGFSDPNDNPANSFLSVKIAATPGKGTLKLNGTAMSAGAYATKTQIDAGQLTYLPAADENGVPYTSFTFQVKDDGGTANGGVDLDPTANTLTVYVTSVNDAPVASAIATQTTEDTAKSVPIAATDVDDAQLSVAAVTQPAHGVATFSGTTLTYTPAAGFTGTDAFTYTVTDGNATSPAATVTITVDPAGNTAPVAMLDVYTLNTVVTGSTLTVGAAADGVLQNDSDADGDPLMALLEAEPEHGTLQFFTNGTFVYEFTPAPDFPGGTDSFTYTAFDGADSSAATTVYINVKAANIAPVADDDDYTATKNVTLTVAAAAGLLANDTDADGDALAVNTAPAVGPGHGTLTLYADGSFTYAPDLDFTGSDSFQYTVTDGADDSALATVTITVSATRQLRFDLTLTEGWNLVSVPIDPVDGGVAVLFGESAGVVWQWNGTAYERAESIVAKQAYWLYCPTGPVTVPVIGTTVTDTVRAVPAGWSLVGPVTGEPFAPVALPRACGARGGETVLPAWRYQTSSRAYLASGDATQLLPGLGYWVYTDQPADLQLGE